MSDSHGCLYVCATPIGNLKDISLRCLEVLKQVDLIAAEDTRHTRKLLNYYDIGTPVTSLHEHNERRKSPIIIKKLEDGKDVALVSDAGMPGISDPGGYLIDYVLKEGYPIQVIPGPSAVTTALALSGLPMERFAFEGFLPRVRKERVKYLQKLVKEEHTLVFYEAPHRLLSTLEDLAELIPDRPIAVCRELTKQHEEVWRGTVKDALSYFTEKGVKGELTLVLAGAAQAEPGEVPVDCDLVRGRLEELLAEGNSVKDAVRIVIEETGIRKNIAYRIATELDK
ncbi:MAG: 16S rRNA (cytidine(1402)-2'-O)-methyltransferase [Firmicutes bacterium]|nr:16S rRNA (cytidine(1402)-2'-O)-methyltransferase [Bacillota bacterium]